MPFMMSTDGLTMPGTSFNMNRFTMMRTNIKGRNTSGGKRSDVQENDTGGKDMLGI